MSETPKSEAATADAGDAESEGRTLTQIIEAGDFRVDEAVRVIQAAAEAIGAAHDCGVVHGDLKGSNVLVTASGGVRITELGKTLDRAAGEASPGDDVCALASLLLEALAANSGSQANIGPAEPTAKVRIESNLEPVVDAMLRSLSRAPERLRNARDFAAELEKAARRIRAEQTAILPLEPEAAFPSVLPDLVGRIIAGRYRIEDVIGRGSTSVVYKARHLELASCVAIKLLSPATVDVADEAMHDRFEFEAKVLASMRHPNVVTIFDLGTTDDGFRYIAMELCQGETLGARLRREPRLAPGDAVSIACQVAEALAALHERGLIHRDVKPANLFITRDASDQQVVKLMDFGLVRALGNSPGDEVSKSDGPRRRLETQAGVILGTGAYMSPELIRGQRLDARSDVYALGVVTYRLLTGSLPFEDADMPRLLARHIAEPPEPLTSRAPDAEISNELERVVLSALAKEPERRPVTARAFADELRAALEAQSEAKARVSTLSATTLSAGTALPAAISADAHRRRRTARRLTVAIVAPAALLALYAVSAQAPSEEAGPAAKNPAVAAAILASPVRSTPISAAASHRAPAPVAEQPAAARKAPGRRVTARAPRRDQPAPPQAASEPASIAPARPARMQDDLKAPSWDRKRSH